MSVPAPTPSAFLEKWWKQFGNPITGNASPHDEYWTRFGTRILGIPEAAAAAVLFSMTFDENRSRARRGLDALRREYKKSHPSLSSAWNRRAAGRRISLSAKQCIAIALADTFKIGKVRILKLAGLADENFQSAADRSKYRLIDRAAERGRRFQVYLKERANLEKLPSTERDRKVSAMVKRTAKSSPKHPPLYTPA